MTFLIDQLVPCTPPPSAVVSLTLSVILVSQTLIILFASTPWLRLLMAAPGSDGQEWNWVYVSASVEIGNAKPPNPQLWEAISITVNKIDLVIYPYLWPSDPLSHAHDVIIGLAGTLRQRRRQQHRQQRRQRPRPVRLSDAPDRRVVLLFLYGLSVCLLRYMNDYCFTFCSFFFCWVIADVASYLICSFSKKV
jgi:hypothetical protein